MSKNNDDIFFPDSIDESGEKFSEDSIIFDNFDENDGNFDKPSVSHSDSLKKESGGDTHLSPQNGSQSLTESLKGDIKTRQETQEEIAGDDSSFLESERISESREKKKRGPLFVVMMSLLSMMTAAALAAITVFVILPAITNTSAGKQLGQVVSSSGQITAVNTNLVTFKGQRVENANVDQKALGNAGVATSPAGFIFGNDKGSATKKVDVYVSLGDQRSRDFLLLNKDMLTGLLESGSARVIIHIVPTGNAFSVYSAEALAESFYTSPKASWNFLFNLSNTGSTLNADKKDEIVDSVVKTATASEVSGVDKNSVVNGTFASWLLSVGDDPKVAQGFSPPAVFVDDHAVDSSSVNLNDPNSLKKEIVKQ